MALGTITKPTTGSGGAPNPDFTVSNKRYRIRDIQITSGANYTTGGETINASAVGLRGIHSVHGAHIARTSSGSTGHALAIDYTNAPSSVKVQAYSSNGAAPAALAELGANANLSTFSARLTFVGY